MHEMLTTRGAEVRRVATGSEGMAALVQGRATSAPYHLLLLDSDIPTEDSFDLLQTCQTQLDLANLKVIMLIPAGRSRDLAHCQALGLPSIIKPVKRATALNLIEGTWRGIPPTSEDEPSPAELPTLASQPSLQILLVDDDPYNRVVIQAYLQHTPHRVTTAENGRQAVEKFKAGRYDLVFMDIHMPDLDGSSAVQIMRSWEQAQRRPPVPIIAFTASAVKEELQECLTAGFTAHVTKPIKKHQLIKTLRQHGEVTSPLPPQASNAATPVQVSIPQAIRSLVPQYLQDQRGVAASILIALEQHDYQTIQDLAHKMRGSGGSFGFDTLSTIGQSLEEAAQNKSQEAIRHWHYELSRYLDRVQVVYH
jgi:CheY-like chemotaxis protein